MKYVILYGAEIDDLTAEVTRLLSEGWRPLGGVAAAMHPDGVELFQAMTQEEEEP